MTPSPRSSSASVPYVDDDGELIADLRHDVADHENRDAFPFDGRKPTDDLDGNGPRVDQREAAHAANKTSRVIAEYSQT